RNQITVQVSGGIGVSIWGNPGLLEQALQNLLTNACKYSSPGKLVRIDVYADEGRDVSIAVTDQGFGIEQRHLPRIFERFYRVDKARSRSQGGTGLGLAIAKHIALMHHGRLEVQSEVGVGSIFTLIVPRHGQDQEPAEGPT
ncbi:MAG TPA: ATP-binding protein, partial [Fibrobacteraceae bacterium]|nr:ATP-binding protein [Fibrobacteraceae bacterium]